MEYCVYVIGRDGSPLMPTTRFGKVRRMLKSGQAKVLKRRPFTIQLTMVRVNGKVKQVRKTTGRGTAVYFVGEDNSVSHKKCQLVTVPGGLF